MNQRRNYGASTVLGENRYDLEGYGNDSTAEFTEVNSRLDQVITECLDFPGNCQATARIWRFKKDPWQFYSDAGELLFTLEHIRFSLIRTEDHDAGSRGNAILRFDWTDHGRSDTPLVRQDVPMIINAADTSGESLMHWDLHTLTPNHDWVLRPVSYLQDIDPGIIDKVDAVSWRLFVYRGRLYEC